MTPEPIQQTIAAYFAATRSMDADAFVATFAPDGVMYDPVGTPPHIGHAAIHQFMASIFGLFETMGLTEDFIFVAGHEAAVKWTGRGRGKNGTEVTFEGVDVFEMNSAGEIQVVHAYWDPTPVLAKVTKA